MPKFENKISVLEVIGSLGSGGAESLLKIFVLKSKKNKKFNIEICTLYSGDMFKEEIKCAGIPVWGLDLNFKYDFRAIIKLITLIKNRKYNIVHVHLFPGDLFVALASLFLPKKIEWVFSEHCEYNRRRSFKIFKILDSFTYNHYSKIICVSNQVKCALIRWLPNLKEKVIVIPNGVILSNSFNFIEKYSYDILYVGRLSEQKGVDILIKSVNIIKNKYKNIKNIKVAIVGNGHLNEKLKNFTERLDVSKEIQFLGLRKDIIKIMKSAKIFVLPSRWEGLPMVILEAMSLGMCIIATTVGGIPEVLTNEKDGILIPPENPEILTINIIRLLEDKNLRKKLGHNAYEKLKEKYSIEVHTKKMLKLYKSLIRK